jgi:hypothetical protein
LSCGKEDLLPIVHQERAGIEMGVCRCDVE